jgi:hypothetical protein
MRLEDRIRDSLQTRAGGVRPRPMELDEAPRSRELGAPTRSRVLAAAAAFAVFVPVVVFGWFAVRDGERPVVPAEPSDPAPVATGEGLEASMVALPDGSMPELTLTFEGVSWSYFAQSGEWPDVNAFPLPLHYFEPVVPPGTDLQVTGDARTVEGELEVLDDEQRATGDTIPLDLEGGSAALPEEPGAYGLSLTGTWELGTAGFYVVVTIEDAPAPSEAIDVLTPAPNDIVSSPVTVSGTADVFEANVRIRVFDAINNMIVDTFTTATCGSGCRGGFSAEIEFAVAEEQQGEIVVFEESAETGKPTNVVRIPVTLVPGENLERAMEFIGTWTDLNGNPVPEDVIGTSLGHEHCSTGDIVFLDVGDPPNATGGMTFVRDTTGELADLTVVRPWEALTGLPEGLESSGYRIGAWELWFDPSDVWTAYLHDSTTGATERWPTLRGIYGCD